MADTWTLLKVCLKNDYNFTLKGKNGKKNAAVVLLMVVCFVPTIFLFYESYVSLFQARLDTLAWESGLLMPAIICAITSFMALPAVMYFSADLDFLLTLPVKPKAIIMAKTGLAALSAMALYLPFCVPVLAAYWKSAPDVLSILLSLGVFLTFWIIPTALAGLAAILLMKFVPALRSKDRFNLIFGLIMVSVSMGIGLLSGMSTSSDALTDLMTDPAAISVISYACVQATWAAQAIVSHSLSSLLLYIGANLLVCSAFVWVASHWYLSVVTNMKQTTRKRKVRENKARSPFMAVAHAEIASLVRSPINFMNCVVIDFIPLIFIPLFGILLKDELGMLQQMIGPSMILPWALPAGVYIGFFMGGMSISSSTVFSRQGQNLYWMKVMPMTMRSQILALGAANLFFPVLSCLLMASGVMMLLDTGLLAALLAIAGMIIGLLLPNCAGMLLDGWHPKLVWTDEAAAVKNNMNGVFSMLLGFGLIGVLLIPLAFMEVGQIRTYMYVMSGMIVLLDGLLIWKGPALIEGWLKNKM